MNYVIAASRNWYGDLPVRLAEICGCEFVLIDRQENLTVERLRAINPRYVFFPHWSYLVPDDIYSSFECIIFHMTDVPFGRGGSPLQNLIARGVYDTKISALRCAAGVDAGPVYMKRPLSLHGLAEEIYLRASRQIEEMIIDIISSEPVPVPQEGDAVCFARRKPSDGNIAELVELEKVFDYIRMLDADGYPKAYVETEHLVFEFQRPALRHGNILADVVIRKKDRA